VSGILGIWNLDGRPLEEARVRDLSSVLAHRGRDGDGVWVRGAVGLACRLHRVTPEALRENQPLLHPSGAVVVFDGRLDDRDELLSRLLPSSRVSADSPDPALVLAAYEAFGNGFAERLTGDFALGLFDPARQQLLLARDAIGIRPLYYCRTGETFLFASEIKALLAHSRVPRGLNDDFLADFFLGTVRNTAGETFFAAVSTLLPGHVAVLTPRGFAARRYWDFDPCRQTRLGSFPEYAEAFRHHFERAVKRRIRSAHPVAVSVSGGLDSSSIFCLAETLARWTPGRYPPIRGVSYISPAGTPADEAAFLKEIERDYDVEIERIPLRPLGLLNGSRDAVWHVEAPFLDEQWNTTSAFLDAVHRGGARVVLTGHWGDQMLFDQAYLVDLVRGLAWGRAREHLAEYSRWLTDGDPRWFRRRFVLDLVKHSVPRSAIPALRRLRRQPDRPWYADALRERARCRESRLDTIPAFATAHARSLYEQARSSYHILCMEWNNKVAAMHGLEMTFPFLDRDLLSFLLGIPGEMQTWNGVPKALLRAGLRDVLPEAIALRRWKADFTDLVNEGMERDFAEAARLLQSPGMAVRLGYVREDVIRTDLERLRERLTGPTAEAAWNLSDLLGLEFFLQVFRAEHPTGDRPGDRPPDQ
jgi:asparagine synthase (glutamine-hydrolysing)